jgi:AcrR family transcriptional regulator
MKRAIGKKEQAERTRERILTAARRLFSKKGFASTSTQEVAREIGMTPGVLYWHFASKEDLLIAVIAQMKQQMASALRAVGASLRRSTAVGPEQLLRAGSERVMRSIANYYEFFVFIGVLGAEVSGVNPRIEHALREAYRPFGRGIAALLRMSAGAHADEDELQLIGQMYVGLVMGGVMHQRLFRDEMPLERALPVLERMTMAGLESIPKPKRARRAASTPARRTKR